MGGWDLHVKPSAYPVFFNGSSPGLVSSIELILCEQVIGSTQLCAHSVVVLHRIEGVLRVYRFHQPNHIVVSKKAITVLIGHCEDFITLGSLRGLLISQRVNEVSE